MGSNSMNSINGIQVVAMVTKSRSCLHSTISIQIRGKWLAYQYFLIGWPCNLMCARTLLAVIALCNNMMESRDGCYGNHGEYLPK